MESSGVCKVCEVCVRRVYLGGTTHNTLQGKYNSNTTLTTAFGIYIFGSAMSIHEERRVEGGGAKQCLYLYMLFSLYKLEMVSIMWSDGSEENRFNPPSRPP